MKTNWMKEWADCDEVPVLSAMLVYKGDTHKGFVDLCEWAARIARADERRKIAERLMRLPEYNLVDGTAYLSDDVLAAINHDTDSEDSHE